MTSYHMQLYFSPESPVNRLEEIYQRLDLPPLVVYLPPLATCNESLVTTVRDVWVTISLQSHDVIRVVHNHKSKLLGSIKEYNVKHAQEDEYTQISREIRNTAVQIALME